MVGASVNFSRSPIAMFVFWTLSIPVKVQSLEFQKYLPHLKSLQVLCCFLEPFSGAWMKMFEHRTKLDPRLILHVTVQVESKYTSNCICQPSASMEFLRIPDS